MDWSVSQSSLVRNTCRHAHTHAQTHTTEKPQEKRNSDWLIMQAAGLTGLTDGKRAPLYHTNTHTLMPTQLAVCATTASPARHRAPHFLMWGIVCIFMCVSVCARECSGQLGFLGLRLRLVSASLLRGRQRSRGIMVCVCKWWRIFCGRIKWASQAAISMCAAQLGVSSSGRRSEKSKWQGLYSPW